MKSSPVVAAVLLLLIVPVLTGCEAPRPGVEQVRVVSLSVPGTPWHDLWLRFGKRLAALQRDDIEAELFITGEIGSEETSLANLRRGRVQIGGFSLQGIATVVPELSLLLAPYLFESRDEVDFVLDNFMTAEFDALLAERGMQLLQWAEVGWTHIYSREPLTGPASAAGLPMRASNALGSRVFAEAIGADLIPVTFSEVIPALQTGLIRSGQSGIGMFAIAGIAREARHLTLTRHAFDSGLIVANRDWFMALSDEHRRILIGAMDTTEQARQAIRTSLEEMSAGFVVAGVTVSTPSAEQQRAWQATTEGSHQRMVERIGGSAPRVYAAILEAKAAWRARAPMQSETTLDN
ncbi:MAG: TRAP transporter substrate-binding protein [Gammaproteobacteria bacterium]|nr:TRAP transporter substrate-binding protein DctP [Gammaproteobacteria bacterium]NNL99804.1 TRAP transporter substrate-binding protein [Gammaproteobacteria bacterium]